MPARAKAAELREGIRRGIDPVEEKREARRALARAQKRGLTFAEAMETYLTEKKEGELRNDKHAKQWALDARDPRRPRARGHDRRRDRHRRRASRPAADRTRTTETASRLRGRIEKVLDWATVAGHRTGDNPARWRGNLAEMLPAPGKVAKPGNHPALALDDAPRWFAALRQREGLAARALEFLTLTAARSGEVRLAAWDEIDLESGLWVVPAARMKAGREHRVPLSTAAADLLRQVGRHQGVDLVFPGQRNAPMSDMTLSAVMRRMQEAEVRAERPGWCDPRSGRPAVPHGLRSTFRDWAAERTDFPREMAEIALAHDVGLAVERAYRRGDMLEKRRAMMEEWAGFLC